MTITELAHDIRDKIAEHLAPAEVFFRGSFANGTYDEYSDIDLQADVHCELNGRFFASLEQYLIGIHGPALVRYDPDFRETTTAQNVRFSFYRLPIFWRIDLTIESDKDTEQKWPSPFPEWCVGTSALMNVVWAVKYHKRGDYKGTNRLLACACEKLSTEPLKYERENLLAFLRSIRDRTDTDALLTDKLMEEI